MALLNPRKKKVETKQSGVTLPKALWDRIDELKTRAGFESRNDLMEQLLEVALGELDREERVAAERRAQAEAEAHKKGKR